MYPHKAISFFLLLLMGSAYQTFAVSDTLFYGFSARQVQSDVLIRFTIRGGIQCTNVRVLRSTDELNFTEVYEFPGICGNPGADESYSWLDENPPETQNLFYRLELGSFGVFSEVVPLRYFAEPDKLLLPFQNPSTSGSLRFYINPEAKFPLELRISDVNGRDIRHLKFESVAGEFELNNLEKGMYFIYDLMRESEPVRIIVL